MASSTQHAIEPSEDLAEPSSLQPQVSSGGAPAATQPTMVAPTAPGASSQPSDTLAAKSSPLAEIRSNLLDARSSYAVDLKSAGDDNDKATIAHSKHYKQLNRFRQLLEDLVLTETINSTDTSYVMLYNTIKDAAHTTAESLQVTSTTRINTPKAEGPSVPATRESDAVNKRIDAFFTNDGRDFAAWRGPTEMFPSIRYWVKKFTAKCRHRAFAEDVIVKALVRALENGSQRLPNVDDPSSLSLSALTSALIAHYSPAGDAWERSSALLALVKKQKESSQQYVHRAQIIAEAAREEYPSADAALDGLLAAAVVKGLPTAEREDATSRIKSALSADRTAVPTFALSTSHTVDACAYHDKSVQSEPGPTAASSQPSAKRTRSPSPRDNQSAPRKREKFTPVPRADKAPSGSCSVCYAKGYDAYVYTRHTTEQHDYHKGKGPSSQRRRDRSPARDRSPYRSGGRR